MIDLEKVRDNRQKIIQKAIDSDSFDIDIYACYFEVKRKLLEEDLIAMGYTRTDIINHKVNLGVLRQKRANAVKKWTDSRIETYGLWHKPLNDIKEPEELLGNLWDKGNQGAALHPLIEACKEYHLKNDEKTRTTMLDRAGEYIPYISDALAMLQLGASKTDLGIRFGWNNTNLVKMGKVASLVGLSKTPDKQLLSYSEVQESLSSLFDARYSVHTIIDLTGMTTGTIHDIYKYGIDSVVISLKKETEKKQMISERRKEVWKAYSKKDDMRSMDELAAELSTTRATISTDIRVMMQENPGALDVKYKRYAVRTAKKEKVLEVYDNMTKKGQSKKQIIQKIKKMTGIDEDRVKSILKRYRGVEE